MVELLVVRGLALLQILGFFYLYKRTRQQMPCLNFAGTKSSGYLRRLVGSESALFFQDIETIGRKVLSKNQEKLNVTTFGSNLEAMCALSIAFMDFKAFCKSIPRQGRFRINRYFFFIPKQVFILANFLAFPFSADRIDTLRKQLTQHKQQRATRPTVHPLELCCRVYYPSHG